MVTIKENAQPVITLRTDRLCTGVVELLAAGYIVVVSQENDKIVMELYDR